MRAANSRRPTDVLSCLCGLECWYVNAGGAAGTSFSLAFGRRVPRRVPLNNPAVSEEFRVNEGEANLYVWCAWRLETDDAAIASSDQEADQAAAALERLQGLRVESIEVSGRALDVVLRFSTMLLHVFCDHVDPDPSSEANWELFLEDRAFRAGPGFALEEELSRVG